MRRGLIALSVMCLVVWGAAIWRMTAPPAVASLPTLAVLPSVTASLIPLATATPSLTPTATPTLTPTPTATVTPSLTPTLATRVLHITAVMPGVTT